MTWHIENTTSRTRHHREPTMARTPALLSHMTVPRQELVKRKKTIVVRVGSLHDIFHLVTCLRVILTWFDRFTCDTTRLYYVTWLILAIVLFTWWHGAFTCDMSRDKFTCDMPRSYVPVMWLILTIVLFTWWHSSFMCMPSLVHVCRDWLKEIARSCDAYIHAYRQTCTRANKHVNIHANMHTNMHAYMHTNKQT